MKNQFYTFLIVLTIVFTSCNKNDAYDIYTIATPKYMTKEDFRASVNVTTTKNIVESGKIYTYNNIILINDIEKGIHIIDNTNPILPVKKSFIEIIGNKDMEVRGDYLYADSLMDLLVFDLSDLNNIKEVFRVEDVFNNYVVYPTEQNLIINYDGYVYDSSKILISWDIKKEYRKIEDNIDVAIDLVTFDSAEASGGQGGSLARFKIIEDYLYAVDNSYINVFDISDLENPITQNDVYAGFGIETIFNRGNYLFLGSTNGMYIYDISIANNPQYISEFTHATACDPVVVDNNYAYVTLRGGNSCGAFDSSLEVIDISVIENPSLVKTYTLDNPYGLGIKNDLLFICDGTSGLKIYNKENVEDLKLLKTFKNAIAYDVIPLENRLIMIGDNVLYQYRYINEGIELLSKYSLN